MSAGDSEREMDRARRLILARRNQFVAAALAGMGAVGTGCGGGYSGESDAGTVPGHDSAMEPDPCGDGPCVCLSAPAPTELEMDAGEDAGAEPRVCLLVE